MVINDVDHLTNFLQTCKGSTNTEVDYICRQRECTIGGEFFLDIEIFYLYYLCYMIIE